MRPSTESASPGQSSAPWHLGASPQGHHWEDALALSWPRALPAKTLGTPVDAFMALSRSTQKLSMLTAEVTVLVFDMDCSVCKIF